MPIHLDHPLLTYGRRRDARKFAGIVSLLPPLSQSLSHAHCLALTLTLSLTLAHRYITTRKIHLKSQAHSARVHLVLVVTLPPSFVGTPPMSVVPPNTTEPTAADGCLSVVPHQVSQLMTAEAQICTE